MRADRFLRRFSAWASRGALCACLWFLGACTGARSGNVTLSDIADASDFATAAPDDHAPVAMDATAGDLVKPDGAHTEETVGHDGDVDAAADFASGGEEFGPADGDADAAADFASGGSDGTEKSGDSPSGDQATLDLPQVEYLATEAVGDQEAPEAGLKCPPKFNVPCPSWICEKDTDSAGPCGSALAYPCLLTTVGSDVELALWFDEGPIAGCLGHCGIPGVRYYRIDVATCTASLMQIGDLFDPACEPENYSIKPVVVGGRRVFVLWEDWHGPDYWADDILTGNAPPPLMELEVLAITSDPGGELLCTVKVPLFFEDGLGLGGP